jgi:hypothetical protein
VGQRTFCVSVRNWSILVVDLNNGCAVMSRGSVLVELLDPLYRKHDGAEFLPNFLQNKKRQTIVTGVEVRGGGCYSIQFHSIQSLFAISFTGVSHRCSHRVQYDYCIHFIL